MYQILKRLELIKTSIIIEDYEIIELQISKLSTMSIDDDVRSILDKLSHNDFGSVIADIETYLARYSGVTVYNDNEIQGLKLELKFLENQLQELSEQKSEYLNELNEFNTQYTLHLGEIIQTILKCKNDIQYRYFKEKEAAFQKLIDEYEDAKSEYEELKTQKEKLEKELSEIDEFDDRYDVLYKELQKLKVKLEAKEREVNQKRKNAKKEKKKFEEDDVTKEYKNSQKDYEEFRYKYKRVKKEDRFELSDDEIIDLKKLYRKASKLCHPDIVADELREQANAIMQQLNEAYDKKDIKKVKEILFNLETGTTLNIASDTINDKEQLKEKIKDVHERLNTLQREIEEIKSSEVFRIIQEYDDWNEYFDLIKSDLQKELERLQRECG